MGVSAAATAPGVHGFPAVLTSFIGRVGPVREVAGLLEQNRLVTAARTPCPATSGQARLSVRERQLVALVAQGRSDAQIAAELYISIRTVRSHLDRIGDKTGCRRRVDLTRLALSAGLV